MMQKNNRSKKVMAVEGYKTKAELIVEMLCDGIPQREIQKKIGETAWGIDQILKKIRGNAGLPYLKSSYRFLKKDIMHNIALYKEYVKADEELRTKYFHSLRKFDRY